MDILRNTGVNRPSRDVNSPNNAEGTNAERSWPSDALDAICWEALLVVCYAMLCSEVFPSWQWLRYRNRATNFGEWEGGRECYFTSSWRTSGPSKDVGRSCATPATTIPILWTEKENKKEHTPFPSPPLTLHTSLAVIYQTNVFLMNNNRWGVNCFIRQTPSSSRGLSSPDFLDTKKPEGSR